MAFGANGIIEVENGGDDVNNGGGFNPNSSGFATDGAATSATGTAPVFTSASYNFVAGDVGAKLFIKSGTNWLPGWYAIASVASNAATLTATIGSAVLYASGPSGMSTAAGCATTASPTGATWAIDYSQQTAAEITFTDMVIGVTTTQFTSVAHPVGPNFVGNYISVTSGTGFTVQRVEVTAFTAAGLIATCDKSLGTTASTGGNGRLGGAVASPAIACLITQGGASPMMVAVKQNATAYSMSATGNVTNGFANHSSGITAQWFGYATNRWPYNADTRPVFQPSANSVNCFDCFVAPSCKFWNMDFVANGKTGCVGLKDNSATGMYAYRVRGTGISATVSFVQANATIENCEAVSNDTNTAGGLVVGTGGQVKDSTCRSGGGFGGGGGGKAIGCLAATCTVQTNGGGFDNFAEVRDCVVYNQQGTAPGVRIATGGVAINTISESNSTYGFKGAAASINTRCINCSTFGNSTAAFDPATIPVQQQLGCVATSASALNAPATPDFTTNATAGAGAAVRAVGYPSSLPGFTGTNYRDIGAYQHQDAAAGGAVAGNFRGGFVNG